MPRFEIDAARGRMVQYGADIRPNPFGAPDWSIMGSPLRGHFAYLVPHVDHRADVAVDWFRYPHLVGNVHSLLGDCWVGVDCHSSGALAALAYLHSALAHYADRLAAGSKYRRYDDRRRVPWSRPDLNRGRRKDDLNLSGHA